MVKAEVQYETTIKRLLFCRETEWSWLPGDGRSGQCVNKLTGAWQLLFLLACCCYFRSSSSIGA